MNDERNLGRKTDDSGQQPRYEHYQFHEEQGTVLETIRSLWTQKKSEFFSEKSRGDNRTGCDLWPGGGSCISGGKFCSRQIPEYR